MWNPQISIEQVDDPVESARHRARQEQFDRNSRWLETHWPELRPQAAGRFLAVAGQEAHVADSPEQAWAWAEETHPEDLGPVVQYVMPTQGPRSYAHRWTVVEVR